MSEAVFLELCHLYSIICSKSLIPSKVNCRRIDSANQILYVRWEAGSLVTFVMGKCEMRDIIVRVLQRNSANRYIDTDI